MPLKKYKTVAICYKVRFSSTPFLQPVPHLNDATPGSLGASPLQGADATYEVALGAVMHCRPPDDIPDPRRIGLWRQNCGPRKQDYGSVAVSQVPEPSTWAMMLLGFAGLGYAGFRRASAPRIA
jgi:hypothetical protein